MKKLHIAIAQMKSTAGDLSGNADKILDYLRQAEAASADLLILPEACLTGYPSGDINNRPNFQSQCETQIEKIMGATKNSPTAILFGAISGGKEKDKEGRVHNSLYLVADGELVTRQHKCLLPNEDVFHEKRHFIAGPSPQPVEFRGINLGLLICNDMWYPQPSQSLANNGADILITCNGSPYHASGHYHADKLTQRLSQARARVEENSLPLVFVNAEGGQDDLVFDGQSFIVNSDASVAGLLPAFDNQLHSASFEPSPKPSPSPSPKKGGEGEGGWRCVKAELAKERNRNSLCYQALCVGLRDYLHKSGFDSAIVGLSGGIDSALVACLATDALGADKVLAVRMPSRFTSKASLDDAQALADNLQIKCDTISIESLHEDFLQKMKNYNDKDGLAGENIQSRLRGNILMYIANSRPGAMVLATGNKSEIAVGYSTLYGDMCGGFAPIKDLYKTRVFELCHWRNETHETYMLGAKGAVIPEAIITKPPSAELRDNQKDEDSLPPYDKLDAILEFLIENNGTYPLPTDYTAEEINDIWRRVMRAEYKRAQGAVGTRVTAKAFGSGWCYPLAHEYIKEV